MADLGSKHECVECGAKFYDLGKEDPICPKCGTNQREYLEAEAAAEEREEEEAAASEAEEDDEEEGDD